MCIGLESKKNGGMEPQAAMAKFNEVCDAPNALTDMLGPTEKNSRRVAVKTKCLLTLRDADISARAMKAEEATIKKPDEATFGGSREQNAACRF